MRALVVAFTQVVGDEWVSCWKKGGCWKKVLIEMLKCSDQLVPVGSRKLRRWLEHRREKHDEEKRCSGGQTISGMNEKGKSDLSRSKNICSVLNCKQLSWTEYL